MISVNRQLPALFLATPKQICANSVQESGFKYLENMNRLMWIVPGGYPKDGTLKKNERKHQELCCNPEGHDAHTRYLFNTFSTV